MSLPALPAGRWPPQFHTAYQKLQDAYEHGCRLLATGDVDPVRLQIHFDRIIDDCKPLLEAFEASDLPRRWVLKCANKLAKQSGCVLSAAEAARGVDNAKTAQIQPVHEEPTGSRGRPRKDVDIHWLKEAFRPGRTLKRSRIAKLAGVHRHTLRARMREAGISKPYAQVTNDELDTLIRHYRRRRPNAGYRFILSHLRILGLHVQRERVLSAMRRVDGVGIALRKQGSIKRRTYKVSRPHALWHMDGHHKLIRWGIVVHGIVDGYSRLITGIRASDNNRATTVFSLFKKAIRKYSLPSRMRADRGRENTKVAVYMVMYRGPHRASFIWGPSTRNTRIERLWGDLGQQCLHRWRAFFMRLERRHSLDPNRPVHLWLLHRLFLPAINTDLLEFQANWNHHPMSGPDMQGLSPVDKCFEGQTLHGVYVDDCDGVHADIIQEYYGIVNEDRAGLEDASDSDDEIDIADQIEEAQAANVHATDPVSVPETNCPLADSEEVELFLECFQQVCDANSIPRGFGLHDDEYDDNYPPLESIPYGRRGNRELEVSLPDEVWYPRAVIWAQAAYTLHRFLDCN